MSFGRSGQSIRYFASIKNRLIFHAEMLVALFSHSYVCSLAISLSLALFSPNENEWKSSIVRRPHWIDNVRRDERNESGHKQALLLLLSLFILSISISNPFRLRIRFWLVIYEDEMSKPTRRAPHDYHADRCGYLICVLCIVCVCGEGVKGAFCLHRIDREWRWGCVSE